MEAALNYDNMLLAIDCKIITKTTLHDRISGKVLKSYTVASQSDHILDVPKACYEKTIKSTKHS